MVDQKVPYSQVLATEATVGVTNLVSDNVHSGYLRCVQRVAMENETNLCDEFRIYMQQGRRQVLLLEWPVPVPGQLYTYDVPIYLGENQKLVVSFTNCTAGDLIRVYINGWDRSLEAGV